jgi:hypothetical protein
MGKQEYVQNFGGVNRPLSKWSIWWTDDIEVNFTDTSCEDENLVETIS